MSYHGESSYVELPEVRNWDPRAGWSITKRYRGTPTAIDALMTVLVAAGTKLQIEPSDDGGYHLLSATYGAESTQPADTALADQWTLQGNDLEKNIWEHPTVVAELNKISSPVYVARLRSDVAALGRGEDTIKDQDGNEIAVSKEGLLEVAAAYGCDTVVIGKLIDSVARGVEAYTVSQFVLRHVLTVASNTSLRPNYTNVGKVYATAQLQVAESIPSTILFELPTGYWLKRTPTLEQVASDKYQITQEWWHADYYDTLLYEAVA